MTRTAFSAFVAGEIEEVVVLAEAQAGGASVAPNMTSVPALERLGEPLPARGEFLRAVAHALGARSTGEQHRTPQGRR